MRKWFRESGARNGHVDRTKRRARRSNDFGRPSWRHVGQVAGVHRQGTLFLRRRRHGAQTLLREAVGSEGALRLA